MNCMEKLKINQCRTCYNATKGLKHLTNMTKCCGKPHQRSYAELISEVSGINIIESFYKELPQFICDGCSRKLKAAHAFIQQTRKVNERLFTLLTDQKETNHQLDWLQETQVDIQACLEIKMEHDNVAEEDQSGAEYCVKLKLEELAEFTPNDLLDVFCEIKNNGRVDDIAVVSLEKNLENVKNENNENIFQKASTRDDEIQTNLNTSEDLFKTDSNVSDSSSDDGQEIKLDEQTEMDCCKNRNPNNKKENLKKFKHYIEMVDEDVAVPCSLCNKIFNNSKALERHQRTSHIPEDQKCTCPLCFRKFSRSCNMYTHMRTFHGPDTVPLIRKPSAQERTYQCDKCPRNYTKRKHLNIHIKNKHSEEDKKIIQNTLKSMEDVKVLNNEALAKPNKPKRYEVRSLCSICGSSFSSKTHLIVHMRRHTGERPFKCDLCDRAYPRISELTCHRRIHTGEKPFACKICGKTFRVSSKMTTHMRSHTDIRPYKCTQCERSFKYSKDLSIHFRIHTGERPYSCNVCGSTFTQSNTLKAHRVKLGHIDVLGNANKIV